MIRMSPRLPFLCALSFMMAACGPPTSVRETPSTRSSEGLPKHLMFTCPAVLCFEPKVIIPVLRVDADVQWDMRSLNAILSSPCGGGSWPLRAPVAGQRWLAEAKDVKLRGRLIPEVRVGKLSGEMEDAAYVATFRVRLQVLLSWADGVDGGRHELCVEEDDYTVHSGKVRSSALPTPFLEGVFVPAAPPVVIDLRVPDPVNKPRILDPVEPPTTPDQQVSSRLP